MSIVLWRRWCRNYY